MLWCRKPNVQARHVLVTVFSTAQDIMVVDVVNKLFVKTSLLVSNSTKDTYKIQVFENTLIDCGQRSPNSLRHWSNKHSIASMMKSRKPTENQLVHRKHGLSQKRSSSRQNALVIVVSLVAAVGWVVLMSFWLTSMLSSAPAEGRPSLRIPGPIVSKENVLPISPIDLWPDNNESFDLFRTLKACDPTAPDTKCKVPKDIKTHRVAIVSPPGEVADFVTAWIQSAVKFHADQEDNQHTDIVLLPTSHVPPYGYGKSHGYTKIIRVASFPMSLAAADTVRFASADKTITVGLEDMKQVTRQVVRWHCRLSHVAAHTPVMTVTMEELIEDPWEIEENLCDFLGLARRQNSGELEEAVEGAHMDEDELMQSIEPILQHAADLLNKVDRESGTESMETVLNSIVADEMQATNDLTAWPCESFWSVAEDPKPTEISPVARRVAQAISPDCSAEQVTCGVKRDKCEERGDAICKD